MSEKETAFKWYCIGYRENEHMKEDSDWWMTDEMLRKEFEMDWEFEKGREMEVSRK